MPLFWVLMLFFNVMFAIANFAVTMMGGGMDNLVIGLFNMVMAYVSAKILGVVSE